MVTSANFRPYGISLVAEMLANNGRNGSWIGLHNNRFTVNRDE